MDQPKLQGTLRQNLKIGVTEGLLATPWVFLSLPGGFIISALLTVHYGLGPGTYGLIASLPAWANALQLILVPVLSRFMSPRDMTLGMSWLNLGLWMLMAGIIGLLPEENASAIGTIFLVFFALTSLTGSLVGVGWTSWVSDWVPRRTRGLYFGKRNRYISALTTVFLVLSMLTLDWFDESIIAYQIILAGAALCRFFSVLLSHRIVARESMAFGTPFQGKKRLKSLAGKTDFKRMIAFSATTGFFMAIIGPFAPVFVYEQLGWTPARFAMLTILATVGGALTMPIWGRMIDRRGCITAISLSLVLWQLQNYLWIILTPSLSWLLFPMWLWGGSVGAGFFLGSFNLVLKLVPTEAKTSAISVHLAFSSVAAGVAPILAGYLLEVATKHDFSTLLCYRIAFFVSPTFLLLSLFLLRRIREPAVSPSLDGLSGTGRLIRQLMQLQGLAFLANATIFARRKKRAQIPESTTPPEK